MTIRHVAFRATLTVLLFVGLCAGFVLFVVGFVWLLKMAPWLEYALWIVFGGWIAIMLVGTVYACWRDVGQWLDRRGQR